MGTVAYKKKKKKELRDQEEEGERKKRAERRRATTGLEDYYKERMAKFDDDYDAFMDKMKDKEMNGIPFNSQDMKALGRLEGRSDELGSLKEHCIHHQLYVV